VGKEKEAVQEVSNNKRPTPDAKSKWALFNETMMCMTHRDVAIVGGAWVQESLALLLKARLDLVGNVGQILFGGGANREYEGWLNSFGGQIALGRAIRLFGNKTFFSLDAIRRIRNEFAHEVAVFNDDKEAIDVSFAAPSIVQSCADLQIVECYTQEGSTMQIGGVVIDAEPVTCPLGNFRRCVAFLCLMFRELAKHERTPPAFEMP